MFLGVLREENIDPYLNLVENTQSKTPPLSEMESINALNAIHSASEMVDVMEPFKDGLEDSSSMNGNVNETIATLTYSGSFKETHIYTPSKSSDVESKQTVNVTNSFNGISAATLTTTAVSNVSALTSSSNLTTSNLMPIDFDYEKAAMGVIIDETVVKKEYRDVVYNPDFTVNDGKNKPTTTSISSMDQMDNFYNNNIANEKAVNANSLKKVDSVDEEFSDFQSMSSKDLAPKIYSTTATVLNEQSMGSDKINHNQNTVISTVPETVSHGMILSPAVLLPKVIPLERSKQLPTTKASTPSIEWGDTTAVINPEEMARIEELFSDSKLNNNSSPKTMLLSNMKSTVGYNRKENNFNIALHAEDEDWSDFVSMPINGNNNNSSNNNCNNDTNINNNMSYSNSGQHLKTSNLNTKNLCINNDDEWSDFVSNTQSLPSQQKVGQAPQFNSGAWQNANYYNNPLSLYHKGPVQVSAPKFNSQKQTSIDATATTTHLNQNNNNINLNSSSNNNYISLPLTSNANQVSIRTSQSLHQHKAQNSSQAASTPASSSQQIHIMQNFSTAPVPLPERLLVGAGSNSGTGRSNVQLQVGSAKVAPSIALIPDLGFLAPAIPTHTSFISSLPRPGLNGKK